MSASPCVTYVVFCVYDLFRNGVDFRPNVSVLDSEDESFSNVSDEDYATKVILDNMHTCIHVHIHAHIHSCIHTYNK